MSEPSTEAIEAMRAMELAIDEQVNKQRMTFWGLLKYLGSSRGLHELVTIETRSFNPLVIAMEPEAIKPGRAALVHALLVGIWPGLDPEKLPSPWAYACWSWPSRRLNTFMELDTLAPLPEATLTARDLLDKGFCDAVEEAMVKGTEIPRPAPALEALYTALLTRIGGSLNGLSIDKAALEATVVPLPPEKTAPAILADNVETESKSEPEKALEPPSEPTEEDAASSAPDPLPIPSFDPLVRAPQKMEEPEPPAVDAETRRKLAGAIELIEPSRQSNAPKLEDTLDLQEYLKKIQ